MTRGLRERHVVVRTPDGGRVRVDPADHREDVLRRLLERGVTRTTLHALLPSWAPMIDEVAARWSAPLPAGPASDEPAA